MIHIAYQSQLNTAMFTTAMSAAAEVATAALSGAAPYSHDDWCDRYLG